MIGWLAMLLNPLKFKQDQESIRVKAAEEKAKQLFPEAYDKLHPSYQEAQLTSSIYISDIF